MSASGSDQASPLELPGEEAVAAFLTAQPDFISRHPELLARIELRHASGDAVSLVERQVAVLREENEKLHNRLQQLLAFARRNEDLNRRIHQLALELMNAAGPEAIFARLDDCLKADFGADRVGALIFAAPAFVESDAVPVFSADNDARGAFSACLDGGETVCGNLDARQAQAVFADESTAGSAVMMPLTGAHWDGVLVIASDDPARFEAGMSTDFLTYLKDIVSLVVDPWVKRETPS